MNNITSNPCTRCGKERIVSKTWTEEIENFMGKTTIKHMETVCPDPECQKVVDEKIDIQKKKKEALQQEREERMKRIQMARKRKA